MTCHLLTAAIVSLFATGVVARAAVDAGDVAARRALAAGYVRVAPVTPLRLSAESIVTYMVEPAFPLEMRAAGLPGYVKLELLVDDDGRVCEAAVLESSAREFSRSALKAAGQWRFTAVENPRPNGRRIVRVPIQFDLVLAAR